MQDPEFEKQVREKMNELRFSPSESVWTRVLKDLDKDNKRKRPFFWYFLLTGVGLAVGGYFILIQGKKGIHEASIKKVSQRNKSDQAKSALVEYPGAKNEKVNSTPISNSNQAAEKLNLQTGENNVRKIRKQDGLTANHSISIHIINKNQKVKKETAIAAPIVMIPGLANKSSTQDKLAEKNSPELKENSYPDSSNAHQVPLESVATVATKDSINLQINLIHKKRAENPKPWKLGFVGSAGIADVASGLMNSNSGSNGVNTSSSAGAPSQFEPSPVHSRISVLAGINIEKEITKRISISVGLNYHYYSTSIQTSQKIDSAITAFSLGPVFFSNNPNAVLIANNPYLSSNPAYTFRLFTQVNQYHFIEIPVSALILLNVNAKTQFNIEAGLTPAQLLSADALVFHYHSGLYYKDNSALNKTQLSGELGLLLGFWSHHTLFRVGPQIQYHFTRLVNQSTGGSEHLYYAGLKLQTVLRKK